MSFIDSTKTINNAETLANYMHERMGMPYPNKQNLNFLKGEIRKFFEQYPDATYASLCAIVDWARDNSVRYATPANLVRSGLRYAFAAGRLPELDPRYRTSKIDDLISEVLSFEEDETWRRILICASTDETKISAYQSWRSWHLVNA